MKRRNGFWSRLLFFCLAAALVLPVTAQPVRADYLVQPDGYWRLEETTPAATGVIDEFGLTAGTCTNCPGSTGGRGQVGKGFLFDGVNDTVTFPGAGDDVFDFDGSVGFTIEMWVKRAATVTSQEAIIGRYSGASGAVWFVGLDSLGRATCDFWDEDGPFTTTQFSGGTVIADDVWHHVVVVRDGVNDRMMIYVDGELDAISDQSGHTITDDSFASTAAVTLGQLNNTFRYRGALDELAVYRAKELSAQEIRQLYLNGFNGRALNETFAPVFVGSADDTAAVGFNAAWMAQAAANPLPSYAGANLPTGAEIDGATGEINWLPLDTQVGSNLFSVSATNSLGTANQSWAITVKDLCASELDGYWKLDSLQSTTPAGTFRVIDELGLTDGTCTNCPELITAGQVGNGLLFDGVDTVTFPGAGDDVFDFDGSVGFTIEMWVKRAATVTSQEAIIGRYSGASGAVWFVGLDSLGRATCDFWDEDGPFTTTQFSGGTVIANDVWRHVVVVRDGVNDRMMIYVDGELDAISDQSGHTITDDRFASTAAVTLGQLNNTFRYRGALDELAVYNTALSPTIIAQHFNAAVGQYYCSTGAPPAITSTAVMTATEGVPYTYQAAATSPGGPVVWSLLTAPAGMAISDTGLVTWTPGGDADEQTAVKIQAAVFGVTATQAFTITVTLTNNPPVITSTAPITATVGTLYTYTAEATDADGDTLTWSLLTGAPAGMEFNPTTVEVTWTPADGSEGDVTYTLSVSDGQGGTATEAVTVTVSAAAVPPPSPSGGGGGGGCFINALGF